MPGRSEGHMFKREPLRPAEIMALRRCSTSILDRAIVETLLGTGIRVAEFSALRPDDLDVERSRLTIANGKGSKRRTVYLPEAANAALLRAWRYGPLPQPRTAQRHLARLARRAHIARPCSPHVLRHTFAVETLSAGVSIETLRQMLGHSHLSITAVYLNLSPDRALAEMADKLSGPASAPAPRGTARGNRKAAHRPARTK